MSAVDTIGRAAKKFFFVKEKKESSHLNKENPVFLVVRLDHLGDILLSTPIPELIKNQHPKSKVLFLCPTWGRALLDGNPFIDEIIEWNAPWFLRGKNKKSRIRKLINELRTKRIDVALCLRGDARENAITALAKIPERYGYGITGLGFLLTEELPYKRGQAEYFYLKNILLKAGISVQKEWMPRIYLSREEEDKIFDRLSEELGPLWQKSSKKITIQIRSGASSKDWSLGNYRLLLERLLKEDAQSALCLVGGESPLLDEKFLPQSRVFDLRGKLSLRELSVLLKHSDVCVGPDSGPMHLAATFGRKTIFLFSGTNEFERWKPLGSKVSVLRHEVSCSPCFLNKCPITGHPCMRKIEVHEVFDAIES